MAVLPAHEQHRPLGQPVGHLVEAAELDHLAGGAAGDDRDGAHLGRQCDEHVGAVGVDVRLRRVGDDRRQRAVEVETDDGRARDREQGVVAGAHGIGEGREVHARHPATPRALTERGWGRDQPVRMTVRRSSRIGATAGRSRLMRRSLPSSLAAASRRGG